MNTSNQLFSPHPTSSEPSDTAGVLWRRTCDQHLKGAVNELAYNTWFRSAVPCFGEEGQFQLTVPNEVTKEFLLPYKDLIANALEMTCQRSFQVEIVLQSERMASLALSQNQPSASSSTPSDHFARVSESKLNPHYTFQNFIVGPSNSFAHAACVAMASMKANNNYNPLFIYGGSGLGKTHLMQAIGNRVLQEFPKKKVIYVQTEQFINEFIQVITDKKYDTFRNKYRKADLLLIDDIQFIEGKERMQEEFFHTFNAIYESGKNIVLTCDKPPQSLQTLEMRLKTRISSGLTIDIAPPEYETRMAILNNLAVAHGITFSEDVMEFMAHNVVNSVRELEGAFKNLLAYSLLEPITVDNTRIVLKDFIQPSARQSLDSNLVMTIVANYYQISVDDLRSKKRNKEIVEPRHLAMYLCNSLVHMTYTDIGEAFGKRNHATVIHACNKIEEDSLSDPQLKHRLEEITQRLKP